MNKAIVLTILAVTLTLTGCSSIGKRNQGITDDPTPLQLDTNDSFAMQVLKSGFGFVPFDIRDTEVSENAYQNTLSYGTSATLGLLGGGAFGALNGLGTAAIINLGNNNARQDSIQFIAWVPADNIDISDKKALYRYVKENYIKPAFESYIASEAAKQMPTEVVDYAAGSYKLKGKLCKNTRWTYLNESNECQMFYDGALFATRYATKQQGLPFKPSVDAERYIVIRIEDSDIATAAILPHIKTNMMYAYVPAADFRAKKYNLSAENVFQENIPYVIGKEGSVNLFIKAKED